MSEYSSLRLSLALIFSWLFSKKTVRLLWSQYSSCIISSKSAQKSIHAVCIRSSFVISIFDFSTNTTSTDPQVEWGGGDLASTSGSYEGFETIFCVSCSSLFSSQSLLLLVRNSL